MLETQTRDIVSHRYLCLWLFFALMSVTAKLSQDQNLGCVHVREHLDHVIVFGFICKI